MRMFLRLSAALCLLLGAPALAGAQGSYPDRPVKFVVAFPPGGATDTFFRQIANDVSAALGQPAIIENRGGGGGYIAWQQVANSEPDGYTLLVAENALGISQALYKNHPSKFDPLKQYDAIAATGSTPLVLTAANNTPFNTFAELVTYSKSLPQKLNYAHAGAGSVTHLSFEVVRDGAGMDTVPVPYKGGGPAVADVVAGHVPITLASMSVGKPLVEGGKLKGLFVTSQGRSPALPNVPSVKEIGLKYADVDLEFWWGIFGPKGIPAPVREKLEKAFQTVMANPGVRERLAKVDTNPTFAPGAALRAKLENEIKNWSTFIDSKGIKVE
ncbi:MAG: tripartite tricarboxylate transporter substrate binding protein [Pseudomonadota bacterium]